MTDEEGVPTAAPDVVEGHELHAPEAETEPAGAEPTPEEPRQRRGLAVLCIVLAVAAFAFAVIAAVATQRLDEGAGERDEIRSVSHQFGEALLTYDYENLDAAKRRVLSLSTGSFRDEYEKAFDGGLALLLRETKAKSVGETEEVFIGPIEEEGSSVTTIVVVNAVAAGTAGRRVLADSYIRLQLVKVGGRWRVDGVTNLNLAAPTSDLPLPTTTTTTPPN